MKRTDEPSNGNLDRRWARESNGGSLARRRLEDMARLRGSGVATTPLRFRGCRVRHDQLEGGNRGGFGRHYNERYFEVRKG